jgi:hypothetical protein
MIKINELIEKIKSLIIKKDHIKHYKELLKLPKSIFLIILKAIVDEKISPNDFNKILTPYREKIVDNIDIKNFSLKNKIVDKYFNNSTNRLLMQNNKLFYQFFIKNSADKKKFFINEEDIENIYIGEKILEDVNLNFDEIKLTKKDLIYMQERNINEIQMKKIKLITAMFFLIKNYRKED